MNKSILRGIVGQDPTVRTTAGGVKVARTTMATEEKWRDSTGERQSETQWHTLIFWRGLADLAANYIRKGSNLLVEGKIKYRHYDNKDGQRVNVTEIEVDKVELLNKVTTSSSNNSNGAQGDAPGVTAGAGSWDDDDTPF